MSSSVVSLSGVRVSYGRGALILNDINFELKAGKITGLIGPSGAGKTTLMRVIVGRQAVSTGEVSVLGHAPGSAELLGSVSYMTQEVSAYQDLTVHQNMHYFGSLYGISDQAKRNVRIAQVLSDVDMTEKGGSLVRDLSGGQKQRVSLAISLMGDHKIIILDEPTTGLDPVLRAQLWKLFKRLKKEGVTVIISSHAMDEAEKCDELVLIRDGKIIAQNTPRKLMNQTKTTSIEASFLKLVGGKA